MQALEMSDGEIQDLHTNSGMQSELSSLQYQLQLSEIAKLKSQNDLEAAKAIKEREKIEGKKQDSKASDSVEDARKR